jgi:hypothetical protein
MDMIFDTVDADTAPVPATTKTTSPVNGYVSLLIVIVRAVGTAPT